MIEHSALTTKVYDWLRDNILRHTFAPGDKLDVQQLATQLGVSRTPVKDAINRLTIEGLVVLRSRQGTYVATMTPETLHELFAAREMFEQWAAMQQTRERMLAAAQRVAAIHDESGALLAVPTAGAFDYNAFVALDRRLHDLIIELAENGVVAGLYRQVMARLWTGRIYYADQGETFARSQVSQADHAAIVAAFAAGDAGALAVALRRHAESSQRHTLTLLARYPQVPKRTRRRVATEAAAAEAAPTARRTPQSAASAATAVPPRKAKVSVADMGRAK